MLALIAVTLVLHLAEEFIAFPLFNPSRGRPLPAWLPSPALQHSMTNLRLALIAGTVIPCLVILWAIISRRHGFLIASLFVEAILLVNGFSHLLTAALRGGYVPGLFTGVLINIPFGIYVFRKVVKEGWIRRYRARQLVIVAILVHVAWLGSSLLTAKPPIARG